MVSVHTLEKLAFLQGFPPEYLKPLVGVAKVVEVPADEILFHEGQWSPNISYPASSHCRTGATPLPPECEDQR
jgi:CRP-like cAMP-binding protein